MREYKIPKELSSELKINSSLYLIDLLLLFSLIGVKVLVADMIHPSLKWWFIGFLFLLGVFLIIRPTSNPQKRMYQAIYYATIRRKDTYSSIDYEEGEK